MKTQKRHPTPGAPHTRKIPDGQCGAKTRAGTPCKRGPLRGATRCKLHGGASPNSIAAAKRRLLAAADPASKRLVDMATSDETRIVTKQLRNGEAVEEEVPRYSPTVQLRAAEAVLDRAGIPRATKVEHSGEVDVGLQRLREIAAKYLEDDRD